MRLLRHKIYWVFPELDRFSDEQCEAFLKRAYRADKRGWRLSQLTGAAWMCTCAVIGQVLAILLHTPLARWEPQIWMDVIAILPVVTMTLIGFAGWHAIHRRHLIRLIRKKVLDASCLKCGYGLLGLPCRGDGEASAITCPECGTTTTLVQMGTTREEFDALRPEEAVKPSGDTSTRAERGFDHASAEAQDLPRVS